jgi:hypothetical protein
MNANLLDSTTFIHEKASIQMLEERQFHLNTNYIKKLLVKNENELIIKKILQQSFTDNIYNDITDSSSIAQSLNHILFSMFFALLNFDLILFLF